MSARVKVIIMAENIMGIFMLIATILLSIYAIYFIIRMKHTLDNQQAREEIIDKQEFYRIEKKFHNAYASRIDYKLYIKIKYWERPLWRHIESLIGEIEGKKVLDVGCGWGRESIIFARRDAIVHAIDISEKNISKGRELAQHMGVNVTFEVGNIDSVEYEEYFDIIFCRAILHHLPVPTESLRRLSCFLRPGGLLIAQEPRFENPIARVGRRFFTPSTATEHPFLQGELEKMFTKIFGEFDVKYFFVLAPLCFTLDHIGPLRRKKLKNLLFILLNRVDCVFFRGSFLRKYAWVEIIHSIKG